MRTLISLFSGLALLTACATPEQQAAQAQRQMDNMIVIYGPACEKLGYGARTDLWRNCILQLSAKDDFARYQSPASSMNFGLHLGYWH